MSRERILLISALVFAAAILVAGLCGLLFRDKTAGQAVGTVAVATAIAAADTGRKKAAESKVATVEAAIAAQASREKLERLAGTYDEVKAETAKNLAEMTLKEKVALANAEKPKEKT